MRSTDATDICAHGTRELRLYNQDRAAEHDRYVRIVQRYNTIFTSLGRAQARGAIQLDHVIPLGIGGADSEDNIWPQPKAEAELKDKLEWRMRDMICAYGASSPEQVKTLQREIATDWVAAYKKYVQPK